MNLNDQTADATSATPDPASPAPAEPVAPVADVTAESSPATPADVQPEDSSPSADRVDPKQTLLDVARDVLAQSRPAEPAPAKDQGSQPGESSPPTEGPADPSPTSNAPSPTDEPAPATAADDFKDADSLPFGKHPRFQSLLSKWRQDREPARQYRQVQDFLDQNGVSPELAAEGLKLAALLQHARRGSAEHARLYLKDVEGLRSEVRLMLGEDVPEDLRERVDSGALDEASAKELAQARSRAEVVERQLQEREAQATHTAQREHAAAARTAVAGWESQVRTRDADYEKKAPLVLRTAKALAAERGAPRTAEEAVKLAQAAYDEVNAQLQSLLPPPRPTAPAAPRPQGGPPLARPAPKTLAEVVRLAAVQGRASA